MGGGGPGGHWPDLVSKGQLHKYIWGGGLECKYCNWIYPPTVYVVIFVVVLFSGISRVGPGENFHFNMAIYSNESIAKLSPHEFPHLVQKIENICREKYGVYSILHRGRPEACWILVWGLIHLWGGWEGADCLKNWVYHSTSNGAQKDHLIPLMPLWLASMPRAFKKLYLALNILVPFPDFPICVVRMSPPCLFSKYCEALADFFFWALKESKKHVPNDQS